MDDDVRLVAAGHTRFGADGDAPPRVFVTSGGCRVVYQHSFGSDPTKTPLVLVGGGTTGRAEACELYGAESAVWAERAVVIFDRRNTGASDVLYHRGGAPRESETLRPENEEQCDDLAELLRSLSITRVALLGHSSGARLVGMYAARNVETVESIVLVDPTGGKKAAALLSSSYYTRLARLAERRGMGAVAADGRFAACAALNGRSRRTLLTMRVPDFVDAMTVSAKLFHDTCADPALALPAADLARIGRHVSRAAVVSTYGTPGDGVHTADVASRVAGALGPATELCVSARVDEWFPSTWRAVDGTEPPRGAARAFAAEHAPSDGEFYFDPRADSTPQTSASAMPAGATGTYAARGGIAGGADDAKAEGAYWFDAAAPMEAKDSQQNQADPAAGATASQCAFNFM